MHKSRIAAGMVAIAATALIAGSVTAEAATAPPASPATAQSPDGYFYTYNGVWFTNFCGRWSNNSPNWGACRNKTESLRNNGYPGALDDVLVYWGLNYTGAWRGVCDGDALPDVSGLTFDYSGGAAGHGESLWHNISSHRWATLGGVCA